MRYLSKPFLLLNKPLHRKVNLTNVLISLIGWCVATLSVGDREMNILYALMVHIFLIAETGDVHGGKLEVSSALLQQQSWAAC